MYTTSLWIRSSFVFACLLALTVAGCSGENGGADADGEGDEIELRLVTTRPTAPKVWDAAIKAFEAEHPHISVTLETTPNNSSELHALLTQRLANEDPSVDVFMMDVVWPSEFALAGYAQPLTESFNFATRDEFFASGIEAYTVEGEIYAVPFFLDAGLLYYREDLLEAHGFSPPRTWDRLVEQAETILTASDNDALRGYVGQFKRYEGLVCNMLELVESAGGDVSDPMNPQTLVALEFVAENLAPLMPDGVFTYEEQHAYDAFRSGNAVFMRNWPYAYAANVEEGSPVKGKVGMAPLPRHGGGDSVATLGGWGFAVSAFSRHPEEAWKLVEHMSSGETQRSLAVATGKVPAHRLSFEHTEVQAAQPHFSQLQSVIERARPRPKTPLYGPISDILQRFYTDALREFEDPHTLVEQAQRAAQRIRDANRRAGLTE